MKKLLTFIALACSTLGAITPNNLRKSYDISLFSDEWHTPYMKLGVNTEYAMQTGAYNGDEKYVAAPLLYSSGESSLAMLEGHAAGTTLNQKANIVRGMQNGARGIVVPTGDYSTLAHDFFAELKLPYISSPGDISVFVGMPIIHYGLDNVKWADKTEDLTLQDEKVRSELTTNIVDFAQNNARLNIGSSSYTGVGDTTVLIKWSKVFAEGRKNLKRVHLHGRAGVVIPVAAEKSQDRALDFDIAHDGTWAMPIGGGIELTLDGDVLIGIDVRALWLGSKTKEWRLKQHRGQTDYLLPSKALATKSHGLKWQFNLYSRYDGLRPGLSFLAGYQLHKYDEDSLYPQTYDTSFSVINSAETKEESRSHNFVLGVTVDANRAGKKWMIRPVMSVNAKIPFGGMRVLSSCTLSAQVGFSF